MINFDDPAAAIALLAILVGLRFALYVVQRLLNDREANAVVPALAPDESPDETPLPPLPAENAKVDAGSRPYRFFAEVLDAGIIAVVLVFLIIRPFFIQAFWIPSGSMVPTLQDGDKVLVDKFSYRLEPLKHGDVVVFRAPALALKTLGEPYDPRHPVDFVKRVVGLPGDHIHIVDGDGVYVNGKRLREPYVAALPNYDFPLYPDGSENIRYPEVRPMLEPHIHGRELIVPVGDLFVLGDNRTMSHDSHAWGFVSRQAVLGKAVVIFWPPSRWKLVH